MAKASGFLSSESEWETEPESQLNYTGVEDFPTEGVPGKKGVQEGRWYYVAIELPRLAGNIEVESPYVAVFVPNGFYDPVLVQNYTLRAKDLSKNDRPIYLHGSRPFEFWPPPRPGVYNLHAETGGVHYLRPSQKGDFTIQTKVTFGRRKKISDDPDHSDYFRPLSSFGGQADTTIRRKEFARARPIQGQEYVEGSPPLELSDEEEGHWHDVSFKPIQANMPAGEADHPDFGPVKYGPQRVMVTMDPFQTFVPFHKEYRQVMVQPDEASFMALASPDQGPNCPGTVTVQKSCPPFIFWPPRVQGQSSIPTHIQKHIEGLHPYRSELARSAVEPESPREAREKYPIATIKNGVRGHVHLVHFPPYSISTPVRSTKVNGKTRTYRRQNVFLKFEPIETFVPYDRIYQTSFKVKPPDECTFLVQLDPMAGEPSSSIVEIDTPSVLEYDFWPQAVGNQIVVEEAKNFANPCHHFRVVPYFKGEVVGNFPIAKEPLSEDERRARIHRRSEKVKKKEVTDLRQLAMRVASEGAAENSTATNKLPLMYQEIEARSQASSVSGQKSRSSSTRSRAESRLSQLLSSSSVSSNLSDTGLSRRARRRLRRSSPQGAESRRQGALDQDTDSPRPASSPQKGLNLYDPAHEEDSDYEDN